METKTIALVAPSGNIKDKKLVEEKIKILEKKFKVKKYYNDQTSFNYLSDTDEKRIEFFEQAFSDDEVDIVLSVRGGYGALRIVDKINYDKIKNSKKIYLGSSDATVLLAALSKKTQIKCFHSLMLTNGFIDNLDKNIEIIKKETFDLKPEKLTKGSAQGKLWGGNLSSLVSLFSSDCFLPDDDIILFLEDLNEPLYKIDKMLYEVYRNRKLKEKIKGIIFGDFYFEKKEIEPLLTDYAEKFNVPCAICFDITHKKNNITIPFLKTVKI